MSNSILHILFFGKGNRRAFPPGLSHVCLSQTHPLLRRRPRNVGHFRTQRVGPLATLPAVDIMRFMGRQHFGTSKVPVITDFKQRPSVTRIKHRVRENWIKMYNKNGIVLHVEMVINRPGELYLFKLGHGKNPGYFQAMRKGITNMSQFVAISMRANSVYLDAPAPVDDTTSAYREISCLCKPVTKWAIRARALNSLRDRNLFCAVMSGEHHVHGFEVNEFAALLGIVYNYYYT